jgi:M6 family metalloprotease-like protein
VSGRSSPRAIGALAAVVCALALLLAAPARAIVANPNPITVTQPDGQRLTLHLVGDEHLSWFVDAQGYTILQDPGGEYRYAQLGPDGDLVITSFRAGTVSPGSVGLTPRIQPSREYRAQRLSLGRAPQEPTVVTPPNGTVKNLVVLAKFSDHGASMIRAPSDYTTLFNTIGGDPVLAPSGSVRDVWRENSYNTLDLVSTVQNWVTLPSTEAWYAGGTKGFTSARRDSMVKDALALLDASVNFATFDANNDGYVDAIDIIHSGYGSEVDADLNRIWSQQWSLATDWVSADNNANGVKVKVSAVHTEPALWSNVGTDILRIGVIAHETGHFFGLPDLYDYDYQGCGVGTWCLMGDSWGWDGTQRYPPHLSAWCKKQLGYLVPSLVTAPGVIALNRAEGSPAACMIPLGYGGAEYLLIENRNPVGFDRQIPQGGLAVWHIDESIPHVPGNPCNQFEGYPGQAGWPGNGQHYMVSLLQADGLYDLEKLAWAGNAHGDAGDLFRSQTGVVLSESTTPNTDRYQNALAQPTANELSEVSAPGITMTFRYRPATWVDFAYAGSQGGDYSHPYQSLSTALGGTADDAIIIFKPGTSSLRPSLTRPMRYKSYQGTTWIGP